MADIWLYMGPTGARRGPQGPTGVVVVVVVVAVAVAVVVVVVIVVVVVVVVVGKFA